MRTAGTAKCEAHANSCFSAASAAKRTATSGFPGSSHSDTLPTIHVVQVRLSASMSLLVKVPRRASLTPTLSRSKRGCTRGMATKSNLALRASSNRSFRSETVVVSQPAVSFSSAILPCRSMGGKRHAVACDLMRVVWGGGEGEGGRMSDWTGGAIKSGPDMYE